MNQNYIQAINFACIIYLTYLTLGISRDNNVLNNLKTKNEDSSDIVKTIKEVLKDELKDIHMFGRYGLDLSLSLLIDLISIRGDLNKKNS